MIDLFGRDLFGMRGLGQGGFAPGQGKKPEPGQGIPRTVRTSYQSFPFMQSDMPYIPFQGRRPIHQPLEPIEEPIDLPFLLRPLSETPISTEIVGMDLQAAYPMVLRGGSFHVVNI